MGSSFIISLMAAMVLSASQSDSPGADAAMPQSDQAKIVVTATRSGSTIERLPISVSVVDEETVNELVAPESQYPVRT